MFVGGEFHREAIAGPGCIHLPNLWVPPTPARCHVLEGD
jgi:hypothetical protein